MQTNEIERLRSIRTFPSLVKYLRDELDWPIESEDFDELTFDYEPKELGLDSKIAVKIEEIKQLRPLASHQPWGIFFIKFAPKRLPVVALRRALQSLVTKRRESANKADLKTWRKRDLLFISSYGEDGERAITFAHFAENKEMGGSPILRVLGWDKLDAPLHIADAHDQLKEKLHWPDDEENLEEWRKTWASAFILRHREVVDTSKKLATRLADLASTIRGRVNQVLTVEDPETGPLSQLYKAFQEILIHDLSEDDFADTYAQTITYGLLAAAIEQHEPDKKTALIVENIADMIPATNPFLKELLSKFITISGRKKKLDFDELGINEVVDLLNNANLTAVLHDFGRLAKKDDPVFYFYEDFIHEYDAKKRKKRGIYFTPPPVVSFIVRSVDEILRKDFGLKDGLADTTTWSQMQEKNKDIKIPEGVKPDDLFVQILDPATGTGTFLVEVIDLIYKTMTKKWEKEGHIALEFDKLWNEYVPKHLLSRLYGFELMMAPYTIAHMKIGLKLKETKYTFGAEERLRVYLTNTLEEPKDISEYFEQMAPALALEAKAASRVKQSTPITIIIGNPPYAVHSYNKGTWISDLLRMRLQDGADSYFKVNGADLGERNPKSLNDDYAKFIRYSQYKLTETGIGVFGFITNHGYIDNPTFRGMRQSLINTYQRINIIDLHGSAKKKEKCPDGSKDDNVFEIQQGVAVNISAKLPIETQSCFHTDFWGTRDIKFSLCLNNTALSLENSNVLNPVSDMYLLRPQDITLKSEYEIHKKIVSVFPENTGGLYTSRDEFTISNSRQEMIDRINRFIQMDNEIAKDHFSIGDDTADWSISRAKEDILFHEDFESKISKILYRIFDYKFTFYSGKTNGFMCRPRKQIMQHLLEPSNICMISVRQVAEKTGFNHAFVSDSIVECRVMLSNKGYGYVFPLYLYPEEGHIPDRNWPSGKNGRTPNLDPQFVKQFADAIGLEFVSEGKGDLKKTFGPEDIFNYIYAVLHSPTYRSRYAEFLKYDFPRVPFTSDTDTFKILGNLGDELVALHLTESNKLNNHITVFPVKGDNAVTKVGEAKKKLKDIEDGKGKLYINSTQYFGNLREEVWNFHIGGYQVCYKWLYDRKKAGRKLSAEDIEHYHKIVVALSETIKIMKQIDETIDARSGWPIK